MFLLFALAIALSNSPAPHAGEIPRLPVSEVPLVFSEGRLIVPIGIEGVGKQQFILDTAASSSVISTSLRDRLPLSPHASRQDTVRGASGVALIEKVDLPTVTFGGRQFDDIDAVVIDISDFREYEQRDVQGILGTDILRHFDLTIDVSRETLRLEPITETANGSSAISSGDIVFESRTAPGFVEFEVQVNGAWVSGVLDTGARQTVLNWAAAEAAGVSSQDAGLRPSEEATRGIDGQGIESHLYVFDHLQIGPAELASAEVKIADLPVFDVFGLGGQRAMLVGADVLEACRVTIRYSTRRLRICQ